MQGIAKKKGSMASGEEKEGNLSDTQEEIFWALQLETRERNRNKGCFGPWNHTPGLIHRRSLRFVQSNLRVIYGKYQDAFILTISISRGRFGWC